MLQIQFFYSVSSPIATSPEMFFSPILTSPDSPTGSPSGI